MGDLYVGIECGGRSADVGYTFRPDSGARDTPRLDFNETQVVVRPVQKHEVTHEFLRKTVGNRRYVLRHAWTVDGAVCERQFASHEAPSANSKTVNECITERYRM